MFVSEIIQDVIEALGRCNRQRAYDRLSDAVQALQDEGDWKANIGAIDICACSDGRTVTLPPEVEVPLAVAVNGNPVFMRDEFYKFHLNGDGINDGAGVPWAWDDAGFVPVFMDIINPSPIIVVAEQESDLGKPVRFLGKDGNGRPLRTQLEDGTWLEGIQIMPNILRDFPGGVMQPSTLRQFLRIFQTTPVFSFTSAIDHELANGAYMQVLLKAGTMPDPFTNGGFYYIRVVDGKRVSLHKNRLDSRTGQNPIQIVGSTPGSVITLQESRAVSSRTQFQRTGGSPTLISPYDLVTFAGVPVPNPLSTGVPYFAIPTDSDKFAIYPTLEDAKALANIINVTDSGASVVARTLKEVSPSTILRFGVNHNYVSGDAVTADTTSGELPAPLVAGSTYYINSLTPKSVTIHVSRPDSLTGANPIVLTSSGSGSNSLTKVIPATVQTGTANNIITGTPHNLNTPSGAGASVTAVLTGTIVTSYTVNNGGSGYEASPIITVSGGAGTGATAQATVVNGVVTAVQPIAGGTGYTSPPAVAVTPAAGSFVRFSTNGTLPDPITQGTVYRAEAPMSADTFSLQSTVPQPINITSLGSGQLFLLITRTFTVAFNPQFKTDATNISTGQSVRFFTQGVLPVTSPTIDQTTVYYLRKLDATTVEVYDTAPHANNLASTTGRFTTLSFGSGNLYFASEFAVTPVVRDNFLDISFSGYLQDLVDLKFTTSVALPAPLTTTDTYQGIFTQGKMQVLDTDGNVVVLTGIGQGAHAVVVARDMSVDVAKSLDVANHQYQTGDAVMATTTDTLPDPLNSVSTYYIRSINNDQVELYDSSVHALALPGTTGRISFLDIGAGIQRLAQEVPAYLVAEIFQIEKPVTDGYFTMYAWDTGRSNNLTFLGDVGPDITNPKYRRIKVGVNCGVVRMRYRASTIKITSDRNFINLDSKMAIIFMVKCLELSLKNFQDEAEKFRIKSVDMLNKRNRAIEGPRSASIQIDADLTTVPEDWMN